MKTVLTLLKNKWTLVVLLAVTALASGSAYSEQITQLILSILGGGQ
ncbi:MAG: hypothetical protein ACYSW8_29795 [Planctomycetota bacterium]|jgi:hypothetical protein